MGRTHREAQAALKRTIEIILKQSVSLKESLGETL